MKAVLKAALQSKKYAAVVSLDVKDALTGAWWPAILKRLSEKGCPANLYALAMAYFSERSATLRTATAKMEREQVVGCPQGSCCGPGFWLVMYDSVLCLPYPPGVTPFAFADDLLLVCTGNSEFEIEVSANEALYNVERWAWESNLEFNPRKTKVMMVTRRHRKRDLNLYLMGERLVEVDHLKHLGITFDRRLCWNRHVSDISQSALQFINIPVLQEFTGG